MRTGMTLAAMIAATPALAASEDAWAEFRTATEAACRALVQAPPEAAVAVEINPFGSDRFGVALVTVRLPDGSADRMVCVMEKKQVGQAEMTAPFASSNWPAPE